jgi:RNA polymerase sigma-70 factor (ECF subfamily)
MTAKGQLGGVQTVEAHAKGPHLDFKALFDAHAAYVWNSLRRLGVREPDLEDLLHDVFLQVHRGLTQYDPSRPIRPWLFGFAFRLASQHRRLARHRYEVRWDASDTADGSLPADEALSREEDRRLIAEALDGISIERRAVFVMVEIDETPMEEVARILEIPVNTGYSRLRRAREDFAAAIKRIRARRGGT